MARVNAVCDERSIDPHTLVDIDSQTFRSRFERGPFVVRHALGDEPLFRLPELAELAATLPANQVEYNAGTLPIEQDPQLTPSNGLCPEETVRRIEQCDSWLVLKNVERDPRYRQLLDRCLASIRVHSERIAPRMHGAEAFVFVSSPHAVTPFHLDPEHNFLFQIRGRKTLHVFDAADREIVTGEDLERFWSGSHRNLRYRDCWASRATICPLGPGEALHLPVAAPHWVKNGDAVSISFSCTFRSRVSNGMADVYAMNRVLRQIGLEPLPAGRSPLRDRLKRTGIRLLRRCRSVPRSM